MLPKEVAVSCINRAVGYTPVDAGFAEVQGRSKWAIPWLEDDGALAAPELWAGFQLYYPMPAKEVRTCTGLELVKAIEGIFAEVIPAMNACMEIQL